MEKFLSLRNKVIEKTFGNMNDMQFAAVISTKGPLLVLAGAGSGKTTVLVNRIACLVRFGSAYKSNQPLNLNDFEADLLGRYINGENVDISDIDLAVEAANPWEILAITFTNKAANELKERIALRLGDNASGINAGTFHSVCGKILRRFGDKIGYTSHFTIYDTDDQKKLLKEIMKAEDIDEKILPIKSVMREISSAKDKLITPAEFLSSAGQDYRLQKIGLLYKKYQARLENNDAMDFDDMIFNTVRLFEECPDVLDYYQNKFKYIMVDEYQDTNHAQYVLVRLLAKKHKNICVVGDDDQSIYRFRGATIENILNFEDEYSNCKVIRLEQNYRSTQNILDAANAVIKNNSARKSKSLWTNKGSGEKLKVYTAYDERLEARYVADSILENVRLGQRFSDHAVLYRMNAQSNALENVFARSGIAYQVIGGMRFFERKEIKDILAYLHIINNPYDDLRLKRIINEPKRGIGETTIKNAQQISLSLGISLYEVFKTAEDYPMLSRAAAKLKEFCGIIEDLRNDAKELPLHELLEVTAAKTGYMAALIALGAEEQDRVDNINELTSSVVQYELENQEPTLSGFLEEISLISDIDSLEEKDRVVLMTIHSAKGLEFKNVYLVGLEEGIFPGNQTIYSGNNTEIEEERRLAYVAITRAKETLTITNTSSRLLYGSTSRNLPSRFLNEIPKELCNVSGNNNTYFEQKINIGYKKPVSYSAISPQKPESIAVYKSGMSVSHRTFGNGIILNVQRMSDDYLLEINFEGVGNKKLMANFAKLKIN